MFIRKAAQRHGLLTRCSFKIFLRMQHHGIVLVTASVLSWVMIGGCAPAPNSGVKVTGSVTMGGQPQEGARVLFVPLGSKSDAMPRGAATDASGKFSLQAPPGNYKVVLSRMVDKDGKVPGDSDDPSKDYTQLMESGMLKSTFPPKYASADATPISVEIPAAGKDLEPFAVEQ